MMVQAMLPHREAYEVGPDGGSVFIPTGKSDRNGKPLVQRLLASRYTAKNGEYTLTVTAGSVEGPTHIHKSVSCGIPKGGMARLLLAYIVTEASKQDSRTIDVGRTMTSFCHALDITPSGGQFGRLRYVKEQLLRLSKCTFSWEWSVKRPGRRDLKGENLLMVDSFHFWERERDDDTISGGTIVLSQRFWDDVVDQCFPIDFRKAQYFRAYPTAYDLYLWLTYRLGVMERKGTKEVWINYNQLHKQLGSHYACDEKGNLTDVALKNFARHARRALREIRATWPSLHYKTDRGRICLYSTGPDVRHL